MRKTYHRTTNKKTWEIFPKFPIFSYSVHLNHSIDLSHEKKLSPSKPKQRFKRLKVEKMKSQIIIHPINNQTIIFNYNLYQIANLVLQPFMTSKMGTILFGPAPYAIILYCHVLEELED